jgi:hypothetical protein
MLESKLPRSTKRTYRFDAKLKKMVEIPKGQCKPQSEPKSVAPDKPST